MWGTCRRTVIWRRGKGHARRKMRFSPDVLPAAIKQRDTIMQNTVEHSRHWWHWSIVMMRFGELWIFMMLIYWVAIGARTANKLSPPCLKGNARPILKTLSPSLKLRLQVGNANPLFTWENPVACLPSLSVWSTAYLRTQIQLKLE